MDLNLTDAGALKAWQDRLDRRSKAVRTLPVKLAMPIVSKPIPARLQPSLAQSLLQPQEKANNIFVNTHHRSGQETFQPQPSQQLTFAVFTLAASAFNLMNHHDHSTMDHSTMDHSAMHHDVDPSAMRRCSMNMVSFAVHESRRDIKS